MSYELNDSELENVNGGETIIQSKYNRVVFTTLDNCRTLKVPAAQATTYAMNLLLAHPEMSEQEFDTFCRQKMVEDGIIEG